MKIISINGQQILDSRGNPTVKAVLETKKGSFSAMVPSGASTGKHEALELRDNGKEFGGKGVLKAVANVNKIIAKKAIGKNFSSQREFDDFLIELDGTPNKGKLGANAILGASMAFSRAMAEEKNTGLFRFLADTAKNKSFVLPAPQLNVLNGGKHAGRENDIQEIMLFPLGFNSYSEALRAGVETYQVLKKTLHKKFGSQATLLGDEGGFAPPISSIEERLELMLDAINEAGYSGKIKVALDCASTEFFANGSYKIGDQRFDSGSLVDFYADMVENYHVVSIEDGMSEDDWAGWAELNKKLGKKIQLVGDDLLVTNVERIKKAVNEKSCNSLLLKVNQFGTVSEAIDAWKLSVDNDWSVIVSHRSGETEDAFIADLCVGLGTGQSKFGAPARSERTAKYNRLLEIESLLAAKVSVKFGGKGFLK